MPRSGNVRGLASARAQRYGVASLMPWVGLILLVGLIISTSARETRAAGMEEAVAGTALSSGSSLAPLNPVPGQTVQPVLFPPTAAGWVGEMRDPRDTAPYLAWHKARMMQLQQENLLREEPDPAEANYDARYYMLDLNLNPTTRILTGTVTARATVVNGPMTQCVLDLATNIVVSSVTSGGNPVTWTHANNLLTVNLDRTYNVGEDFTLVTQYSGNPAAGGSFGWDTEGGQPMIWTLSEAFGARTWWPCKDYPEDKADSVDVKVTVPTGLITASNGKLIQQTDNGTTAFSWWHEDHPITTYLVSLAIHNYNVYSDWYRPSPSDSMEIRFYNYIASVPQVEPVQAKVKDMIAAYAAKWGEYPFLNEKYGHAEFPWGGGMEHQTCTSLGYFGESVVAHELAHQWWGDMITCKTFHDIWLNEGFATYCEAIWAEANGGIQAYHDEINLNQYFGAGTIYVPNTNDWNRIFDSNLSYNKASWVLHMLRGMVGDTDFFQILRNYYTQYKYSVATTADFQAVAEAVTGRNLTPFFQEWIYGEYYPIYKYNWTASPAGGGFDISLDVQQVQTWQLFDMSIPIVVTTANGTENFQIQNSLANQNYILHVNTEPTAVDLDPENWILRVILAPLPNPTFTKDLLVVNGVDWDSYGTEIRSAYDDHAFTGTYSFDFWDCFNTPAGGYPASVPTPLGHGSLPASVLGQYKNVIWAGNNFNGDLVVWNNAAMLAYLEAGGNVLLMTRMGDSFLIDPYRNYLGITWINNGTVTDCISTYLGLTSIARVGTQSYVAGFNLSNVGSESTILYKAVAGHTPNWGLGVIRRPPGGGTYNPNGGRFILLNGRPYRWNHTDLKTNITYMLSNFFGLISTGVVPGPQNVRLDLAAPSPNPFGGETTIRFVLPVDEPARLSIWDISGRRIRTLLDGSTDAGGHLLRWNGRDQQGREVASGIYYVGLEAGTQSLRQKVLRLR